MMARSRCACQACVDIVTTLIAAQLRTLAVDVREKVIRRAVEMASDGDANSTCNEKHVLLDW